MRRRGFNQTETAAFFGWDVPYVSQVMNGRRNPALPNAVKIERLTGIPVEAWLPRGLDIVDADTPTNNDNANSDKA